MRLVRTNSLKALCLCGILVWTATTPGRCAADPASQGWTLNNVAANQFADGYDSGDGGWRTVDGTTAGPAFYDIPLTAADNALLAANRWQLSATFSMDSDAKGSSGGFVANYYDGRGDDDTVPFVITDPVLIYGPPSPGLPRKNGNAVTSTSSPVFLTALTGASRSDTSTGSINA